MFKYPESLKDRIDDFVRYYLEVKFSGKLDVKEMEKRFNELLKEIRF